MLGLLVVFRYKGRNSAHSNEGRTEVHTTSVDYQLMALLQATENK